MLNHKTVIQVATILTSLLLAAAAIPPMISQRTSSVRMIEYYRERERERERERFTFRCCSVYVYHTLSIDDITSIVCLFIGLKLTV